MKRGEVWTAAGGPDYAGKPRPVVILQDDRFAQTTSVTVCPFTTAGADAPIMRIEVAPSAENGLVALSAAMADKVATVAKAKLGRRLGRLDPSDLARLEEAVAAFLGLAK